MSISDAIVSNDRQSQNKPTGADFRNMKRMEPPKMTTLKSR
jgi:hypothetical protein